jgi:Holliday junction resolvasome RuvABC endonuclease subunit
MVAVAAGVLRTPTDWELPKRLAALAQDLRELIDELRPDAVAV